LRRVGAVAGRGVAGRLRVAQNLTAEGQPTAIAARLGLLLAVLALPGKAHPEESMALPGHRAEQPPTMPTAAAHSILLAGGLRESAFPELQASALPSLSPAMTGCSGMIAGWQDPPTT
jgi:hypothetical protein